MELLRTSLFSYHQKLSAKMAAFAGFEMPIQYSSVKEEVSSVRCSSGVFDVSHMGEFFIEGKDADAMVDFLLTNDIKRAAVGRAIYSPLCRENGTIVDDLIAYKIARDKILLCVNAANIKKDWEHISKIYSEKKFDCSLTDKSDDYSLLAIQGPTAARTLVAIGLLNHSDEVGFDHYSVREIKFAGDEIILARTGYTGEDGFEIFCNHNLAQDLWDKLLNNRVVPCGLAARDVLRLEVCYPLYGHELSDEVTPLDCGLKWTVKFNERDFVAKSFLQNYQSRYQLIKLSLDEGVPRQGYLVKEEDAGEIGIVTSGTMSPTIKKGIALAHIEKDKCVGKDLNKMNINIVIRGKNYRANVHEKAFIVGGHK